MEEMKDKGESYNLSQYLLVADMLEKVTNHLTARYGQVRKELDGIMGGKVLEFKGERLLKEGRQEGREQGKIIGLADMVRHGFATPAQGEEMAQKMYGVSPEEFRKVLAAGESIDERMQG